MAGKKREESPDAGATMQIDAIADDLEDIEAPGGYLPDPGPSLPPPLPPKRVGKAVWVVGGLVVVLMIALGVGAGFVLFGGDDPAPVAPASPPPTESTEPEAPAAEPEVMQIDEVVFEAPADP